jgi:hypothetical protein
VLRVEHTRDTATIILTWGQLTLRADAEELTIHADADSPENLRRIQDMTTGRLLRFGRRERLDVQWASATGTPGQPQQRPGSRPPDQQGS